MTPRELLDMMLTPGCSEPDCRACVSNLERAAQAIKMIRDATARAAGELCEGCRLGHSYDDEYLQATADCANAIRAHFHLAPKEGAPRDE